MINKDVGLVEKTINDLIDDLEIKAQIKVEKAEILSEKDEEKREIFNVQIDSEQAASLIGFHGETLQSLQLISSLLSRMALGRWVKVLINVGDYRQKREEQLQKLALNLAMKAKFSQEQQIIPNLSASERRIVHLALAERPDIYTVSEGEGKQRQLIIRPKTVQ